MEDIMNKLPDQIKSHLKNLVEASGLPDNEESLKKIAENWINKEEMFEGQIHNLNMLDLDSFGKDDKRPALILTYSGSLVSLGPDKNGRWLEYASIKMRNDVPDILNAQDIELAEDIKVNSGVQFKEGPIKKTSSIFKVAVCKEDVPMSEQEKRIREATIFLTNGFVKLNRHLTMSAESSPEQFNLRSMINYIAAKNNITQAAARKIIEDLFYLIETGMLLGERVSIAQIGSLSLKLRAAQKARVIKNPATGEEMTVEAKPATYVPKVSFSKSIKQKASNVPVDD